MSGEEVNAELQISQNKNSKGANAGSEKPFGEGITGLALTEIGHVQELNTPTFIECDQVYRTALKNALEKRDSYGKRIGVGGSNLLVTQLEDFKDVVIKKLHYEGKHYREPGMSAQEYWDLLQEEHRLAEEYFGRRFVPYTEFITIEKDVSLGQGYEPFTMPQYLMVQDRIHGVFFDPVAQQPFPLPEPSDALKKETAAFINCYENMMREKGLLIENQIMVDFDQAKIKVSDTNEFISFSERINQVGRDSLAAFGIDPESIATPEALLATVVDKVPALADFKKSGYASIRDALNIYQIPPSKVLTNTYEWLQENYGESMKDDFMELVKGMLNFPPQGEHNLFVAELMRKFGVTQEDLALTA